MEGEHMVREEEGGEDSASTTPREDCLSPDTPTPTHHTSANSDTAAPGDNNIEQLKMQLKEVRTMTIVTLSRC